MGVGRAHVRRSGTRLAPGGWRARNQIGGAFWGWPDGREELGAGGVQELE